MIKIKRQLRAGLWCFILFVGISGSCGRQIAEHKLTEPIIKNPYATGEVHLEDVLLELEALDAKDTGTAGILNEIKSRLRQELIGLGRKKFASRVPSGENGRVDDLTLLFEDGQMSISFTYKNVGDYDQNGVVGISDIFPLADLFFEKKIEGVWQNPLGEAVDGNSDGKIDINDVFPISENFFNNVAGYEILGANEENEDAFQPVGDIAFASPESKKVLTFRSVLEDFGFAFLAVRPYDNKGNKGLLSNIVQVNQPPIVVLSADVVSGTAPLTVNFDASQSSDPDGIIVSYEWDFNGDKNFDRTTSEPSTSYTYSTPGSFFAVLRATDNLGVSAEDGLTITVVGPGQNIPPRASLSANPRSGDAPLFVSFDASASYDPDGLIILYEWDFDGDSNFDASSGSPTKDFVYQVGGDFEALVRVTDNQGGQDTATVSISVTVVPNRPPSADLSANPLIGNKPLSVSFDASKSTDPDGNITSFQWDFDGDGNFELDSGLIPSAQFTYQQAGFYDASVKVTDAEGLFDTAQVHIIVNEPPPPSYSVSGTITTKTGKPVQGVAVKLEPGGYSANTNVDGEFVISGVFDGNYTLTPGKRGHFFSPTSRDVSVSGADVTGQDFNSIYTARTWGGSGEDWARTVSVDASENAYAAGTTRSFGSGGDVLLLKYLPDSRLSFARTWGGSALEEIYGSAYDPNSGAIYLVGHTQSYGPSQRALILKYTASGNISFVRTWSYGFGEVFNSVVVDASGTVYVGGSTSFGLGNSDAVLATYSSNGSLLWSVGWGTVAEIEVIKAIALAQDGGIYAGGSFVSASGDPSFMLLKFDSSGGFVWGRSWGGISSDEALALALDQNDNIYLAGVSRSFGLGDYNLVVLKFDKDGTLLWQKAFGEMGDELAEAIFVDAEGKVFVAGRSNSYSSDWDVLLLVLDGDGNQLYAKLWGTGLADEAMGITFDGFGNLYIVGRAGNIGGNWTDALISETAPNLTTTELSGDSFSLAGTEFTPTGTETFPTGVEDDGGGGSDALFLRNLPEM